MENTIFITCYFGLDINNINYAPFLNKSFFFCNNKKYKKLIEARNWIFVYVKFPIHKDVLISSLQSKYIKFLIFLKRYHFFRKFHNIIYFDHKEIFNKESFNQIQPLMEKHNNRSIIIRKSEYTNTTLKDEIKRSQYQAKYSKNLNKTISLINLLYKNSYSNPIYNTGFIIYMNINQIYPLLQSIYNYSIKHQQPQCQIYFSLLSPKYQEFIHSVEYKQLNKLKRKQIIDNTLFIPSKSLKLLKL
jgi:hypothetical protein